jgi:hypothetical protein
MLKLNRNLDALSRAAEGIGPMKPGNRYLKHGAKSYRILILKDEDNLIINLFLC